MDHPDTTNPNTEPAMTDDRLFTPREREVLAGLALGLSNQIIATRLCLSEKTVKNRVSDILSKLLVKNRTQAARWALTHGLDEKDFARIKETTNK